VFHATAPTCFWSWGYEAVLNRLPLVYGDQIEIQVVTLCVYDDFDGWLKQYDLTFQGLIDWYKEGADLMGVPLFTDLRREMFPPSVMPASLAAMAAYRQGKEKGARFVRAVLRRFLLEGQDVTKDSVLRDAAAEASLDVTKFLKDSSDRRGLQAEYERQGAGLPHVPLGFYNVVITDGQGRTVILDEAFEPAGVEDAIDYLSRGTLKKHAPSDIVAYLHEHGPAPLSEIARVFGVPRAEAEKRLATLQKAGKIAVTTLAGAPHWRAALGNGPP